MLDEVGQFQILEEDVEELVARQHEQEIVLSFALVRSLPAASAASARFLDMIAGTEDLVAGEDPLPLAALAGRLKCRLADPFAGNGDVLGAVDVGDPATGDGLVDGLLDPGTHPSQESAAVSEALVFRVETAVDEIIGHVALSLP